MSTHVLTCECGWRVEIEGWLDALEMRSMHLRNPGHVVTVDLVYTRETNHA